MGKREIKKPKDTLEIITAIVNILSGIANIALVIYTIVQGLN